MSEEPCFRVIEVKPKWWQRRIPKRYALQSWTFIVGLGKWAGGWGWKTVFRHRHQYVCVREGQRLLKEAQDKLKGPNVAWQDPPNPPGSKFPPGP